MPKTTKVLQKRKIKPTRKVWRHEKTFLRGLMIRHLNNAVKGMSKDTIRDLFAKKGAVEELIEQDVRKTIIYNDCWLDPGIVVKLKTERYGSRLNGKKAVVEKKGLYKSLIRFIDSGETLEVNQYDVSTIIPASGSKVLVVGSAFRRYKAVILDVDYNSSEVSLRFISGLFKGLDQRFKFKDVTELYDQS